MALNGLFYAMSMWERLIFSCPVTETSRTIRVKTSRDYFGQMSCMNFSYDYAAQ